MAPKGYQGPHLRNPALETMVSFSEMDNGAYNCLFLHEDAFNLSCWIRLQLVYVL